MIVARKNRNRSKLSLQLRSIPLLAECRDPLRLEKLVLHSLREHPRLAPAPHFLATRILHDELVRTAIRKGQLHHSRRVVANSKLELHASVRMHRKRRRYLGFRFLARRRSKSLLVSGGPPRKSDGSGTKQGNYQAIWHHKLATSARGAGYITKFTVTRPSTYQQPDDRAILK